MHSHFVRSAVQKITYQGSTPDVNLGSDSCNSQSLREGAVELLYWEGGRGQILAAGFKWSNLII
jgi:hypothetical protein